MTENSSPQSVTEFINQLRRGDEQAAQKIWERFLQRLTGLAHRKLAGNRTAAADEDDVVQVAFAQFFTQFENNRFPQLKNRDDLWQILAMLVERRSIDQLRKNNAHIRGGGKVRGESVFIQPGEDIGGNGIANIANHAPTEEMVVAFEDTLRVRLQELNDDNFRQIVLLNMQGYTNREIAEQCGSSLRTVERRLQQIRERWANELDSDMGKHDANNSC